MPKQATFPNEICGAIASAMPVADHVAIVKNASLAAGFLWLSAWFAHCAMQINTQVVDEALKGKQAVFVVTDTLTGETYVSDPALARESFGPCSTFKIWNTLIGLELGILKNPDDPFWKWDGEKRSFPDWNRDLSLREAFQASCVPAFQNLAREIGSKRMQEWLDKLGYGNKDMCDRPDSFWLPRAGQPNILITPEEQAALLNKLVTGKLPVRKETVDTLLDIMRIESSARSTLFGKTGSGLRAAKEGPSGDDDFDMGWLVGILDCGGHKYSYACLVLGSGLGGKDARAAVQKIFRDSGML